MYMDMKTFVINSRLEYREFLVSDSAINKFYQMDNPGVAFNTIPDACMDLQFVEEDGKYVPYACGSFLESTDSPTGHHAHCFGVKFNPGMVPKCMKSIASELIGNRKRMDEQEWLLELAEKLFVADCLEDKIQIFQKEFPFEEQICEGNRLVEHAMKRIREENGCMNIASLAQEMGYNQKYMDRVFHGETGMTMKKYATIIRLQAAIHYLQEGKWDEVYEKLGYYDQSHFIKEFKKYTSLTPSQFSRKKKNAIV